MTKWVRSRYSTSQSQKLDKRKVGTDISLYTANMERRISYFSLMHTSFSTLKELISKRVFAFLIITYLVVFFLSSTRSVSADETESIMTIFNKVKRSDTLDPRFCDHGHLIGYKITSIDHIK